MRTHRTSRTTLVTVNGRLIDIAQKSQQQKKKVIEVKLFDQNQLIKLTLFCVGELIDIYLLYFVVYICQLRRDKIARVRTNKRLKLHSEFFFCRRAVTTQTTRYNYLLGERKQKKKNRRHTQRMRKTDST